MRYGLESTDGLYNSAARAKIERRRVELNEAMARIFDPVDGVDFVITASNPDVAFDADGPLPSVFGGVDGRREEQRPTDVPGQPARQPGDLDPGGHARRSADRTAGRRPPLQRRVAARPGVVGRARPAVAFGRARFAAVTDSPADRHPTRSSATAPGHRPGARRHDGRVRDHRGAHGAADDHRSNCTATRSTASRWPATRSPTSSRWSSPAS